MVFLKSMDFFVSAYTHTIAKCGSSRGAAWTEQTSQTPSWPIPDSYGLDTHTGTIAVELSSRLMITLQPPLAGRSRSLPSPSEAIGLQSWKKNESITGDICSSQRWEDTDPTALHHLHEITEAAEFWTCSAQLQQKTPNESCFFKVLFIPFLELFRRN